MDYVKIFVLYEVLKFSFYVVLYVLKILFSYIGWFFFFEGFFWVCDWFLVYIFSEFYSRGIFLKSKGLFVFRVFVFCREWLFKDGTVVVLLEWRVKNV